MAAVLPAPRKKDGRISPNTVAHSPVKPYYLDNTDRDLKTADARYYEVDGSSSLSSSTTSSAPTSPESTYTSFPYPSSDPPMISLDSSEEEEDDEIVFPAYEAEDYFKQGEEVDPPTSVVSETESTPSPATPTFPDEQKFDRSSIPKSAGDDNSIEIEPTTQVDYLSHEWKEEEIWASWRYVTTKKDRFNDPIRLENASWRAWSKFKDNLQIISPEKLRWRKDCDVTWLYGPLQTGHKQTSSSTSQSSPVHIPKTDSFLNKKPILKKKSASEAILQRSLSTHTLLKHAGAIVRAQEVRNSKTSRAPLERSASDFAVPLVRNGIGSSTVPTETSSSGVASPGEKRRIHFNNEVSQCIAVEAKDCEEQNYNDDPRFDDDEPSDDGLVTMKKLPSRTPISSQSTPRNRSPNGSKIIAPLPSTTLKFRPDAEPKPQPGRYSFWSIASNLSSNLSSNITSSFPPSFSSSYGQNILGNSSNSLPTSISNSSAAPPSQTPPPENNFLLNDHEEEYDDLNNTPNNFKFTWNLPKASQGPPLGGAWFVNPNDEAEEEDGLHFPNPGDSGLLDRVADTVNTARDIAHVIWNVGWRR